MSWTGIKDYGFGGKHRTKEEDDDYRSRIKGVPRKRYWTKERCIEELEDNINILKKILKQDEKININDPKKLKQESVKDIITLQSKMLDYMRYLYPPVQQSVNLNIDITADRILERLRELKKKKLGIVVTEIDENN